LRTLALIALTQSLHGFILGEWKWSHPLAAEVAALAERDQVLGGDVAGIVIDDVVDSEDVWDGTVRSAASLADPIGRVLHARGDRGPVGWVAVSIAVVPAGHGLVLVEIVGSVVGVADDQAEDEGDGAGDDEEEEDEEEDAKDHRVASLRWSLLA